MENDQNDLIIMDPCEVKLEIKSDSKATEDVAYFKETIETETSKSITMSLSSVKNTSVDVEAQKMENENTKWSILPHAICTYMEVEEFKTLYYSFCDEGFRNLVIVSEWICKETGLADFIQSECGFVEPKENEWMESHKGPINIYWYIKPLELKGKRFSHRMVVEWAMAREINWVLFRDCDTTIPQQSLQAMLKEVREETGLIGPVMVDANKHFWSILGPYTEVTEIRGFGMKHTFELVTGNVSIVTGACFIANIQLLREVLDDYTQDARKAGLTLRNSLMVEDARLSVLARKHGFKSAISPAEVAWNLPSEIDELIVQRRRWFNGGIATAFSLFTECPIFLSVYILTRFPECLSSLFSFGPLFHNPPTLIWMFSLLSGFLRFFTIGFFFRRSVMGWKKLLWTLFFLHLTTFVILFWMYFESIGIGNTLYIFLFMQLCNLFINYRSPLDLLFTLKNAILVTFVDLPICNLVVDVSLATISDVSWGVRESDSVRNTLKKSSSESKLYGRSYIKKHLLVVAIMIVVNVVCSFYFHYIAPAFLAINVFCYILHLLFVPKRIISPGVKIFEMLNRNEYICLKHNDLPRGKVL